MNDQTKILNGNELIIQGGLEAGFSLYTGYPGSPLADFFNILNHRKAELAPKGIKVVIANSEANAAAMASGAKQAGKDCLVAMKSMGLHVAADALSVGNFANPGEVIVDENTGEEISPGVVIAVGDDPWSISTSTPADSRYLFKHLHIPFLEPSNPQELKDWMAHALTISKRTSVYQGLLLTTYLAEGGGRVTVGTEKVISKELVTLDPEKFDLSKNVMVPPNSLGADRTMIKDRFPKVEKVLEEMSLDITYGAESDIGFISSGVIFETLKQVLEEGDYLDKFSLYKLACSYPIAQNLLLPWLKSKKSIVIVEEKRGFLETEIKELCQKHKIDIQILGKKFGDDEGFATFGGLSFEHIKEKVHSVLGVLGHTPCAGAEGNILKLDSVLPRRLPTFCPGCPHRETLSLLKRLRQKLKGEGIDLITHGDVGCYSLSFLPPFKEMHNLSAMGQGGALGAGLDMFTTNPSVVLMGDSTFFHSGLTDISNSVQAGHNITYILLDNDNTAMTGHQMTPLSGYNVEGLARPEQDMLNAVSALGVSYKTEVNPSDRYFYENLLTDVIKKDGVKVIISNKECGLTFHGKQKRNERKLLASGETVKEKSFFQINTDACEDCRACIEETGCPGLSQAFDAYGSKVTIDPQICVSDSYCTKIKACPSFEEVIVKNYHPTKYQMGHNKESMANFEMSLPLPEIKKSFDNIAEGSDLRIVVTGVGGSGVTTISRVLAEAARDMNGRDDLDFKFVDQKGLAQRNGNVTGHLAIFKKGRSYGAVTPSGSADLLVSPDLLDGSQHLHFLSDSGLGILDKQFQVPLSIMLDDGVEQNPINNIELKNKVSELLGNRALFFSLKEICHLHLGKSVYASAAILGACFQSGRLPFSLSNMADAFKRAVPKAEIDNNWSAFQLGRKIYIDGDADLLSDLRPKLKGDISTVIEKSLVESMLFWHNKKFVLKQYHSSVNKLKSLYPSIKEEYVTRYVHDIFIYDRGVNVAEFLKQAAELKEYYKTEELQKIALRSLAKTYFIKDEVFVSHMMIGPLKVAEDIKRYGKLGRTYKVKRINRPSFDVFGKHIEFDISPTDLMLKTMRHMRILRLVLKSWHKKEKSIGIKIRRRIMDEIPRLKDLSEQDQRVMLKKLENIKGYREIRYSKFDEVFNK
jgi:indolepyruvate ferredoxin oxidoreductase